MSAMLRSSFIAGCGQSLKHFPQNLPQNTLTFNSESWYIFGQQQYIWLAVKYTDICKCQYFLLLTKYLVLVLSTLTLWRLLTWLTVGCLACKFTLAPTSERLIELVHREEEGINPSSLIPLHQWTVGTSLPNITVSSR